MSGEWEGGGMESKWGKLRSANLDMVSWHVDSSEATLGCLGSGDRDLGEGCWAGLWVSVPCWIQDSGEPDSPAPSNSVDRV